MPQDNAVKWLAEPSGMRLDHQLLPAWVTAQTAERPVVGTRFHAPLLTPLAEQRAPHPRQPQ